MSPTPLGYRVVRRLGRWLLAIEYRRVEISGLEREPEAGACVLVANHQNSLVDSLAILVSWPRVASPLAKAPLWKVAILKPFLNAVDAVPVYRVQDTSENEGRGARANLATFDACKERLRAGGSIVLFPEGVSQPAPKLMPLRTGAARIALDAEVPIWMVPVGLSYEPPGERRGTVLAKYGEPFLVDGRNVGPARRGAIAATTRRIEASLRALLAEAESQGDLAVMRVLTAVLEQEREAPEPTSLDQAHGRIRRMAHGFAALRRFDPVELDAIRAEADAFSRHLSLVGVPLELLDSPYDVVRVVRFVGKSLLLMLVVAPFAIVASVVTWPVRAIGDLLVLRQSRVTEDVLSIHRIIGRALVLSILSVLAGIVVGIAVSPWAGLAALLLVPALFVVHVAWRDGKADVVRRVKTFFLLAGGRLRKDLQEQRRALASRLERSRERLEAAGIDLDAAPGPDVGSLPSHGDP